MEASVGATSIGNDQSNPKSRSKSGKKKSSKSKSKWLKRLQLRIGKKGGEDTFKQPSPKNKSKSRKESS